MCARGVIRGGGLWTIDLRLVAVSWCEWKKTKNKTTITKQNSIFFILNILKYLLIDVHGFSTHLTLFESHSSSRENVSVHASRGVFG